MQQGAGSAAYAASPGDLAVTRGGLLRPVRSLEILAHFSGAFDIAEQRQPGHAARVAYLAHEVGRRLGFGSEERRRLLAISATHERWDGGGRPHGLGVAEIPVEALLASAAHWACEHADSAMSPLRARAELQNSTIGDIEPLAGPEVAAALRAALRDDQTWLAMWSDDLPRAVGQAAIGEARASHRRLEQAAQAMGEVVDSAVREPGRSARVAALARQIAVSLGLPEAYCEAIGIVGNLLDLGQLSVPRHVTDKRAILTVDEMELMRCHPGVGARLIERAPGLADVAEWVAMHHERPDGRGYPEMLSDEELPIPPRILAVADAYCALRAERPYRPAFSADETTVMMELGAGRQFDARVVEVLPEAIEALAAAEEAGGGQDGDSVSGDDANAAG